MSIGEKESALRMQHLLTLFSDRPSWTSAVADENILGPILFDLKCKWPFYPNIFLHKHCSHIVMIRLCNNVWIWRNHFELTEKLDHMVMLQWAVITRVPPSVGSGHLWGRLMWLSDIKNSAGRVSSRTEMMNLSGRPFWKIAVILWMY